MFYHVKTVTTKDNFILSVLFTDGVKTGYDIKPLFDKWEVFNDLKTIPGLYQQVKVDAGGFGISWNDNIDLASEELRLNGVICTDNNILKITAAKVVGNYMLLLTFSSGEKRIFDATQLTGPAYEPLKDIKIFENFKLSHGVITWMDEEIDCAPEYMYKNSYEYTELNISKQKV